MLDSSKYDTHSTWISACDNSHPQYSIRFDYASFTMDHWLLLNDAPAFGPGISLVRILDLQHWLRRATSVVDEILVQHSVALRRVSSHLVIWVLQVIAAFELKPLLQNESETLWTASDLPSTLGA